MKKKIILIIMMIMLLVLQINVFAGIDEFGGIEEEKLIEQKEEYKDIISEEELNNGNDIEMLLGITEENGGYINLTYNEFNLSDFNTPLSIIRLIKTDNVNGFKLEYNHELNNYGYLRKNNYQLDPNTEYRISLTIDKIEGNSGEINQNSIQLDGTSQILYFNGSGYRYLNFTTDNTGRINIFFTISSSNGVKAVCDYKFIMISKTHINKTYLPNSRYYFNNSVYTGTTSEITIQKIVEYIGYAILGCITFILMWFGIRKLIRVIRTAMWERKIGL